MKRGLDRLVALDRVIERTAKLVRSDTLLLFTADHSFDFRIRGGTFGKPILEGLEAAEKEAAAAPEATSNPPIRIPALRVENGHTGEEVLVAAQGPGAQRVRGYMANTDIFGVMMAAYGWQIPRPVTTPPAPQPSGR